MRIKFCIPIFLSMSFAAFAATDDTRARNATSNAFKLNYKNINTLGALICSLDAEDTKQKKTHVIINKFSTNKTQLGDKQGVNLSGVCNGKVNIKTKDIISYGKSFELDFDSSFANTVKGTLGVKKIILSFTNNTPAKLKIINPYSKTKKVFNLGQVNWAKNNSIINFNTKDLISIKHNGRVIATESGANLQLLSAQFYNIWSFNSFGCSIKSRLNEDSCQELVDVL